MGLSGFACCFELIPNTLRLRSIFTQGRCFCTYTFIIIIINICSQGAQELILVDPPVRTDYCEDLTPQSCKLLGLQNNKFCLSQSVKNYACREFCGTCGAVCC